MLTNLRARSIKLLARFFVSRLSWIGIESTILPSFATMFNFFERFGRVAYKCVKSEKHFRALGFPIKFDILLDFCRFFCGNLHAARRQEYHFEPLASLSSCAYE